MVLLLLAFVLRSIFISHFTSHSFSRLHHPMPLRSLEDPSNDLVSSHHGRFRTVPVGRSSRKVKLDPDRTVRETDHDASIARLSSVSKRYIQDAFAGFLVPSNQSLIRAPWVNIGTHHRTYVIDELIDSFLRGVKSPKQILSLGSGSDSRYWRLKSRWGDRWPVEKWIETDFKETVTDKIRTIMQNDPLRLVCGNPVKLVTERLSESDDETQPPTELYGNDYCLISVDLRQPDQFSQKLTNQTTHERLFDPTCSTLIIAELVFLYMSPEQTESCLRRLTSIFEGKLMIITYEALNLNDNFSKMMVQNLSARGLSLPGFDYNSSVESQIRRFHDLGFTEIVSSDMKKLRESNGDDRDWRTKWDQELKRIKGLEFLDEVEELELVLQHYAISWATKGFVESPTQSNQNFRLPNLT